MKQRAARRSADQWFDIIQAQAASGQTIRTFCAENDVGLASFGKWKNRLKSKSQNLIAPAADFQPVKLVEPSGPTLSNAQASKVTVSIGAVTLTIEHGDALQ